MKRLLDLSCLIAAPFMLFFMCTIAVLFVCLQTVFTFVMTAWFLLMQMIHGMIWVIVAIASWFGLIKWL
jgi:hypothetical protein